jgi:hypothetical protein
VTSAPAGDAEPSPVAQEGGTADSVTDAARRRHAWLTALRVVVGGAFLLFVVVAVVRKWHDVRTTMTAITPLELVAAELLVLGGLAASVVTWRIALSELGSTIARAAAAKIYVLGQLGKYFPGSFWALAAQMELAKRAGVPRMSGMAASLVAIGVNVVTGLAIGLALVPTVVSGSAWRTIVAFVVVAAGGVALSPPVLTRLVNLALRVIGRTSLERGVSWRGILAATGWSIASWASYGLSLWLLAMAAGAPALESLPLCLTGMALAMTVGFLVVVAPSGIGVREAVIVAALAPVLDRPAALAVALVARLLFTIGDLVAAAAVVPVRIRASEVVRNEA